MLRIQEFQPSEIADLLTERHGGNFGLLVEDQSGLLGYAIAQLSTDEFLVVDVRGELEICKIVLHHVTRLARSRAVKVWVATRRRRLRRLLGIMGFILDYESHFQGEPACLYVWQDWFAVPNSHSAHQHREP